MAFRKLRVKTTTVIGCLKGTGPGCVLKQALAKCKECIRVKAQKGTSCPTVDDCQRIKALSRTRTTSIKNDQDTEQTNSKQD